MTIDERKEMTSEKGCSYEGMHGKECAGKKEASSVEEAVHYRATKRIKEQGEYTIEDYYTLPDDQRVELIDGILYDMAAPSLKHQMIAGEIYRQIANYIRENNGACIPFISPISVQLDCDDKTMVQPDVLILCDNKKITKKCIYGAPDFVLEVLSRSTRHRDSVVKLRKYAQAGVREYWIIDPWKDRVLVYDFEKEQNPTIYGLSGKIPVGIYQGQLKIEMDSSWKRELL